ncbi:hypothetical protein [Pseudomonas sp. TNT3]|jgi:hypothetical protein|uniref:hypothetical protein n=1 Tax=Pseudomonas sp. TNT3 TaxID=2654097 RepID=UPI0013911A2C|nr:hypothetical protein [Pseudomonas sp. TNT3]KAI2675745.1 hypothetical protein GBC55_020755 [Pseudomonas sp. TNT3]
MEDLEGKVSVEVSRALVAWRIARRQLIIPNVGRARSLVAPDSSSPTKELDAVVLGNTLVGYGDNVSLENMTIIENIIKFSKMEATLEVPGDKKPREWHRAFLSCMEDLGCYVPDSGTIEHTRSALNLTMSNIVADIIKAGVDAAKAAIPGATVLGAIADSTLESIKKEPDIVKVFNYEVTKTKGVKLAILPCEQLKNGLIMIMLSSIDSNADKDDAGLLFFDLKTTSLEVFRAASFITFNPLRYAQVKDDIEQVLNQQQATQLNKRFKRHQRIR